MLFRVVLEKTLESPVDSKEIQPVHPKGNQSCIFSGRTNAEAETPILWPPDAKNCLIWKDPDAGKHWKQGEKGNQETGGTDWKVRRARLHKCQNWGQCTFEIKISHYKLSSFITLIVQIILPSSRNSPPLGVFILILLS